MSFDHYGLIAVYSSTHAENVLGESIVFQSQICVHNKKMFFNNNKKYVYVRKCICFIKVQFKKCKIVLKK